MGKKYLIVPSSSMASWCYDNLKYNLKGRTSYFNQKTPIRELMGRSIIVSAGSFEDEVQCTNFILAFEVKDYDTD